MSTSTRPKLQELLHRSQRYASLDTIQVAVCERTSLVMS